MKKLAARTLGMLNEIYRKLLKRLGSRQQPQRDIGATAEN